MGKITSNNKIKAELEGEFQRKGGGEKAQLNKGISKSQLFSIYHKDKEQSHFLTREMAQNNPDISFQSLLHYFTVLNGHVSVYCKSRSHKFVTFLLSRFLFFFPLLYPYSLCSSDVTGYICKVYFLDPRLGLTNVTFSQEVTLIQISDSCDHSYHSRTACLCVIYPNPFSLLFLLFFFLPILETCNILYSI